MSAVEEVLGGTVGHFWPQANGFGSITESPERGYLRLDEHGTLTIETLYESAPADDSPHPRIPRSILARTAASGLILLGVRGAGWSTNYGGVKASVRNYRATTMVTGIDPGQVMSDRLTSLSAFFPGAYRWAATTALAETPELDTNDHSTAYVARLAAPSPEQAELDGKRRISISTFREVTGPLDARVMSAPLEVVCTGQKPTDFENLLSPLLRTQDLISLAHGGLVAAAGGLAEPHLSSTPRAKLRWWDSTLMLAAPGVVGPNSMSEIPLFTLQDVGGIRGLRRWIKLCQDHPRAVGPIVGPQRYGGRQAVESRILDIGAAINYWIDCHRRLKAEWSRIQPKALATAKHVGSEFERWVGDLGLWAKAFDSAYNGLRHDPSLNYDPQALKSLAESGSLLLTSCLLIRASGGKRVARAIFSSHRSYQLGVDIRELLTVQGE